MKMAKFAAIFIALSIIVTPVALADLELRGWHFVGLWQGVDPLDGSEALRSITVAEDGTFKIIGSESYFSGCGSDRGIVEATGYLEGGVLVTTDFTLTCDEGGPYPPIDVEYVFDRMNRTIVEVIGGGFPSVVLHRINKRY